MGTGSTIGTAGGAALGTAIAPGIGTVVGGALGGLVGGLFDGGGGGYANAPMEQTSYGKTSNGYQLEADRSINAANLRAAAFGGYGNAALQRSQQLGQNAQMAAYGGQRQAADQQFTANNLRNYGVGQAAQAGYMGDIDRNSQYGALSRLRNFYEQGPGPSAAEAQMRAGQDANMAQSIALARSGRGAGANANAMRNAAFQNAATGQQMNQQLGVLRANENQAYQQQRLAAMGLEQQTLGGLRSQDINQQGQNYGFATGMGQQGLGYGQLGAQYQNIGNQAQLGFEGMGNTTNLGFQSLSNTAANQGEEMRNRIFAGQQASDTSRYGADRGVQVGMAGVNQRSDAADQAFMGSILSSGIGMMGRSGGGGGTGTLSDYSTGPNGYYSSDVRNKKNIEPADMGQVFGNGGPDLRQAQGYEYNYKDPNAPGAAPGRQVGPMAQNLPPSVVSTGPDGKKQVDAGRLTLVNTAAVSELQRRTDELEQLLNQRYGESSGGPSVPSSMIGYNQYQPTGIEAMQASRYGLPTQATADRNAANLQQQAFGR